MSLKGVNFQLSATNAGQAAFNSFNRGLKGVQQNIAATKAVSRSWNAGLSENRRSIQQLGFQMTDFGVQIAGGQNAMLAFVQQGGQMLQVFGPIGAILATLLTIFGTLAIVLGKTGVGLEQVAGHFGVLEEEFMSLSNGLESVMSVFMDVAKVMLKNLDLIVIAVTIAVGWFATKWVAAMLAASMTTGTLGTAMRALALAYTMNGAAAAGALVATSALNVALNLMARTLPFLIIGGLALLVQWLMSTEDASAAAGNGLRSVAIDADGLKDATQSLSDATNNYVGSAAAASMSTFELMDKYGSLAFAARDALAAMAAVDQYETVMAMNAAVAASIGHILTLTNDPGASLYTQLLVGGQLAEEQARRVESAIRALDSAQGLPNQARAAAELVNELIAAYGTIEKMPEPVRLVVLELSKQVTLAGEVTAATRDATVAQYEFVSATGAGQSGLAGMVAQAWALVGASNAAAGALWGAVRALGAAKGAQAALSKAASAALPSWEKAKNYATGLGQRMYGMAVETKLHNEELATQYALYGQGTEALREQVRLQDELYGTPKNFAADTGKGGGGGGGGGGGSEAEKMNPVLERQKQLLESIIGPMEKYKVGSADLQVLLDRGAITMGQYTEKLRELRMAYLEAQNSVAAGLELGLAKLTQQFSDATKIVSDTVESMGQLLSSSLSEAFKTGEFDAKKFFSSLIGMIIDAITQLMIMKPLMEAITGGMGGGGGGGGLGGWLGKLFSFDGGGSTGSRPRTGGLDGKGGFMAMVHPDETIVDHTKGQSAGGGRTVNVTMNITTRDAESFRASKGQLQAELARMVREGTRGN